MIAGLEEITSGELYINGCLVNDVAPKDRNIAMVFQNYALYPHMSAYKNMAFGLKMQKMPKDQIKKIVEEVAKILDIEHLLDRKPKQLSGGQCQRVALGRAMVRNPAVFLLDEPLSNLDAKLRTSMRTELSKLHDRLETTFVYVTHDQVEAMAMGDRIVVMKDGFIQQVDTPQNLYDNPCNLFVASFIGMSQMNFIEAIIEKSGTGFAALSAGTVMPILPECASTEAVSAYVGREVILGIRQENLYLEQTHIKRSLAAVIEVKVEVSELMGSEIYLYCGYQGSSLTVKISSPNSPKKGETLRLTMDCSKLHLFDRQTGNVIK